MPDGTKNNTVRVVGFDVRDSVSRVDGTSRVRKDVRVNVDPVHVEPHAGTAGCSRHEDCGEVIPDPDLDVAADSRLEGRLRGVEMQLSWHPTTITVTARAISTEERIRSKREESRKQEQTGEILARSCDSEPAVSCQNSVRDQARGDATFDFCSQAPCESRAPAQVQAEW
eukprot:2698713-Rhodomonas_salina.3